ncbi:MAG: hypothetical protein JST75_02215 [Bacteroidetes bacterium]|nr:hypothetical protein [Bacteroidota bacterium]
MIEVFKTNVEHSSHADMLICEIHQNFSGYSANFDLDDCDKILRVQTKYGFVESFQIIEFLKSFGFHAEILSDEVLSPSVTRMRKTGFQLLQ